MKENKPRRTYPIEFKQQAVPLVRHTAFETPSGRFGRNHLPQKTSAIDARVRHQSHHETGISTQND